MTNRTKGTTFAFNYKLKKTNMRRIITMFCLIVAGYTQVSAQQLYKKVFDNAIAVVNNAKSTDEQIQINQFKVTALNYMTSQVDRKSVV